MKSVLCIFRAACFSPGMVERDEAILRAVASRLQTAGCDVSFVHEEEFDSNASMPDIVVHMARSSRALDILSQWQDVGCRVFNSVDSIYNVEREALARLCVSHAIPSPKTWVVETSGYEIQAVTVDGKNEAITFPCWVKRAGDCAQQPNDVCRVGDSVEYSRCLSDFHSRNIAQAVVMEHLEGVCVKFYAVSNTDFCYCLPANRLGYDKWVKNLPVNDVEDVAVSTAACKRVARLISLLQGEEGRGVFPMIYGGDAIIGSDGIARLIDLNDWPSFSTCREEAADAIAGLVLKD